ncbi:MAG: ATP-binding cassette domain-containing protein, partial [Bacteroidetes bacterium]|nr:ATP-binding cassette domain-containing protein [Bacteroidota bacterium]
TAPDMSIAENLAMASKRGKKRGLGKALSTEFAKESRERTSALNMGLEDRLDIPIGKLSGGQRQALTLLMATWNKPWLLLLDEHTAALDPKTADKVIALTRKVIEEQKLTTMMVTHSMQQAALLGDRLIMMNDGKIVYDFSGAEKQRLRPADLFGLFEEIRRKEKVDPAFSGMLSRQYV